MHEQKNVFSPIPSLFLVDLPLCDENSNALTRCVLLSFTYLLVCVCVVLLCVLLCISHNVPWFVSLSLSLFLSLLTKQHWRFCASFKLSLSFLSTRRSSNFPVTFFGCFYSFVRSYVGQSRLSIYYRGSLSFGCPLITDFSFSSAEEIRKNWFHRVLFIQQQIKKQGNTKRAERHWTGCIVSACISKDDWIRDDIMEKRLMLSVSRKTTPEKER